MADNGAPDPAKTPLLSDYSADAKEEGTDFNAADRTMLLMPSPAAAALLTRSAYSWGAADTPRWQLHARQQFRRQQQPQQPRRSLVRRLFFGEGAEEASPLLMRTMGHSHTDAQDSRHASDHVDHPSGAQPARSVSEAPKSQNSGVNYSLGFGDDSLYMSELNLDYPLHVLPSNYATNNPILLNSTEKQLFRGDSLNAVLLEQRRRRDATLRRQNERQSRRRGHYWSFFTLNCGALWAYQSVLQAQSYYVKRFPKLSYLPFVVMLMTTWPLLLSHVFQVASGIHQALGFHGRILTAYLLNVALGIVFIAQDLADVREIVAVALILMIALITAITETLSEAPLYAVASLFPSGAGLQAMQAGNASAGMLVFIGNVLSRLVAGGGESVGELRTSTVIFFGIQVFVGLLCLAVWVRLYNLPETKEYLQREKQSMKQSSHVTSFRTYWHDCGKVLKKVILLCMAQTMTFALSLAMWPTIPGKADVYGMFARGSVPSWWFNFVVLSFNAADWIGRLSPGIAYVVQRYGDWWSINVCVLRVALTPFIICPQRLGIPEQTSNWVTLGALFILGYSNGFVSTVGMMQAPLRVLPEERDMAAYWMVACLYLGLGLGSTISYVIDLAT